jgi:Nif-specific regulatory protein
VDGRPLDDHARLRLLHELGCAFAARLELDELIPLIVGRCQETFAAEGASVLLLDADRGELYFPYAAGPPEVTARLAACRFPASAGIAGEVLASNRAVRVDDVSADMHFYGGVDRATGLRTRAILCAPLTSRDGTIGVIQVVNPVRAAFDDDDLACLEVLASSVAVAIENARIYARLKESAAGLRAQLGALRRDLARRQDSEELLGTGPAMEEVFRLMESAAATPIAVLIEGETGTGKELVARGIHRASPRGAGPFLAVNCAALPEALLESELFGHRRGAFTGAIQDQQGLFEAAGGGTVFLDEIGEMPPAMQAKLLRVLQESAVTRVGDPRPRPVDVRVISATNRDLAGEVREHRFRQDLYYRLAAFPIHVPPLREHRFDVPRLADRFLAAAAGRAGKRIPGIHPEASALLESFGWPGNVRELQNEIARAVALARDGESIGPAHLSAKVRGEAAGPAAAATPAEARADLLRPARSAFERRHIARVLGQEGGNVSRAARALGLSRAMLQKKMKEYALR